MSWLAPCFYNPAGLPSLLLWYVCVNFSSPQCRWLPLLPRNDAGCLPQKKSTAFTDKLTIMSHWARNVTLSLFTSYVCFKFSFCDSAVVQLMIFNVHVNFFLSAGVGIALWLHSILKIWEEMLPAKHLAQVELGHLVGAQWAVKFTKSHLIILSYIIGLN